MSGSIPNIGSYMRMLHHLDSDLEISDLEESGSDWNGSIPGDLVSRPVEQRRLSRAPLGVLDFHALMGGV